MSPAAEFIQEFSSAIKGRTEHDVVMFARFTRWFVEQYAVAYEMSGDIYLVLDNSIVQAFKHRRTQPKRELLSLAYTAFCRFCSYWSDRSTYLALSPCAIYEHSGRKPAKSVRDATAVLTELKSLLGDTRVPVVALGFVSPAQLFSRLEDVHHDDNYLSKYIRALDRRSWRVKLRTGRLVRFPFAMAYDFLPDDMPLKYFELDYVKHILSSRIERYICAQSDDDPAARPISSGALSKALADLNYFSKAGRLQGLGDIDIVQTCDISRQFKENAGATMLGQTVDRDLAQALTRLSRFSRSVSGRGEEGEVGAKRVVDFLLANNFAEEERRGAIIESKAQSFLGTLYDACDAALRS